MHRGLEFMLNFPFRWRRWIKDVMLDFKYGYKFLGGNIVNGNTSLGRSTSTSSDYDAIFNMFSKLEIKPNDVLIDIGCGKGRLFNWALQCGIQNKLIGIEVNADIAEFTRSRLQKYHQVEIFTGDFRNLPEVLARGTIFYLFNPFSENIVKQFADQMALLKPNLANNRPIIIYYNCCYLHVFKNNSLWTVEEYPTVSSMNLSAAIISFSKD